MSRLVEEPLTRSVIGAFFEVYNTIGYGFLEHVYLLALQREITTRGHVATLEVPARIVYKAEYLTTHRLDMLVEGKLIVEAKSSETLPKFAERQLYNYLKATGLEIGLLLHFGPTPRFYRLYSKNLQSVTGSDARLNANEPGVVSDESEVSDSIAVPHP